MGQKIFSPENLKVGRQRLKKYAKSNPTLYTQTLVAQFTLSNTTFWHPTLLRYMTATGRAQIVAQTFDR